MVPKLHAKGTSFKGAAAYLLHDKGADTSERVAWCEVRNLASDDPETAWRIMAATALDQSRLKAQAGVKNTGRKSDKHVLHFTLSWHPEQSPSPEEMARAADGALAALKADDRQAMLIAHDDEEHAHVHVLVNRVSPIDGRHLSSSKEKLALSQWAESYERETGIYCENRIINNAERAKGDYVRGEKERPRHLYELEAANDNRFASKLRVDQKAKDAALAERGRQLAKQHQAAWKGLREAHSARIDAIASERRAEASRIKAELREQFRPKKVALNQQQRKDAAMFTEMEKTFFGRARNTMKAIDLARHIRGQDVSAIIKRSFGVVANAGARQEAFQKGQEAQRRALDRDQAKARQKRLRALRELESVKQADNRERLLSERAAMIEKQEKERAGLKVDWVKRNRERQAVWERARALAPAPPTVKSQFDTAAGGPRKRVVTDGEDMKLTRRYDHAASKDKVSRRRSRGRGRGGRR